MRKIGAIKQRDKTEKKTQPTINPSELMDHYVEAINSIMKHVRANPTHKCWAVQLEDLIAVMKSHHLTNFGFIKALSRSADSMMMEMTAELGLEMSDVLGGNSSDKVWN